MPNLENAATDVDTGAEEELAGAFDDLLGEEPDEEEEEDAGNPEESEEESEEQPDDEDPDDEAESDEEDADSETEEENESVAGTVKVTDATPVFTIQKADGTEEVITAKEAKAGYLRTKDYTQKNMVRAEKERAADAAVEVYTGLNKQYKEFLDKVTGTEPDWEKLRKDDPEQYLIQKDQWRDLQAEKATVTAEDQRLADEQRGKDAAALAAHLEAETVKLHEALPHWKAKPAVAQREASAIQTYLTGKGFTPEQIGEGMRDHRMVLLVRDAALLQQMRDRAKTRVKAKPQTTLRPGATPVQTGKPGSKRQSREASIRLRKTGSVRDAAKAFEDMPELE